MAKEVYRVTGKNAYLRCLKIKHVTCNFIFLMHVFNITFFCLPVNFLCQVLILLGLTRLQVEIYTCKPKTYNTLCIKTLQWLQV